MANMFDSNETENTELFEEIDEEDNLESQIRKLQEIKEALRYVKTTHAVVKHDAKDIIQKLVRDLTNNYDTTFLGNYYNVLESNNTEIIKQINNTIFSSIELALKRQRIQKKPFEEAEIVLMAAWLSVAVLCGERPALATRMLQALIAAAKDETMKRLALMWQHTATAEMLLELSDATRASPDHASSVLADMLLRGALLATTTAPRTEATGRDKLAPHEVAHALDAEAECTDESLSALFRIAARVLADKRSESLMASVERAAVAARVRARARARARLALGSNSIQVTTPTTLRMLFGKKTTLPGKRGRKPGKRGRKRKIEHPAN